MPTNYGPLGQNFMAGRLGPSGNGGITGGMNLAALSPFPNESPTKPAPNIPGSFPPESPARIPPPINFPSEATPRIFPSIPQPRLSAPPTQPPFNPPINKPIPVRNPSINGASSVGRSSGQMNPGQVNQPKRPLPGSIAKGAQNAVQRKVPKGLF